MATKEVNDQKTLLHVEDLQMHFPIHRGVFQRQVDQFLEIGAAVAEAGSVLRGCLVHGGL